MAETSKTLYCSNYPYPSNYNYTLKVSWSESSPSIANNTSVISITGSIGSSNLAWDSYYNSYLKLYWYDNNTGKETLVATSAAFLSCGQGYGGTRSVSKTITVTHKSDGSLSGYAKVVFEAGSTSGGYSPSSNNVATSTLALTTIARASDFSYSAGTELGQAITMTIDRKSDAFTHKVEYSFAGSSAVTVSSSATTSASFTPAVSLATNIPNSTIGSLTMKVTTFNGSTQIGDPVTKSVDLSVPPSVVPTMGNPTATRVDNGIPSGWGVYVKGYSKVTIAMTSVSGSYDSTIKLYSITGPNLSSTRSSATSNVLVTAGTNTYTCRITDSRGRTAKKTLSISVADYSLPSIKATAVRCSSDGSANKNGTYLKVTVDWNIASVSSKNSVSSRSASCNGVSNTSFSDNTAFVLAANCSIGSSYTLTASVTDALGNSSTATVSIPTSSRVMNVRKNKDGLSIGKFSEKAGFEVDWKSYFNDTVDINGKLTGNNAKLNGSLEVDGDTKISGNIVLNGPSATLSGGIVQSIGKLLYPVGAIYITYGNTNPGNFLGGTWVQFGQGRTLIGQGEGNDGSTSVSFTAGATIGKYKHTLSHSEIGRHNYGALLKQNGNEIGVHDHGESEATPFDLLQPSIVVYFWRRTA